MDSNQNEAANPSEAKMDQETTLEAHNTSNCTNEANLASNEQRTPQFCSQSRGKLGKFSAVKRDGLRVRTTRQSITGKGISYNELESDDYDSDLESTRPVKKKGKKSGRAGHKHNRNPWQSQEDEILKDLVQKHGTKWSKISQLMGGTRTGKQIRDRWVNKLDTSINEAVWTPEEDDILLRHWQNFGNRWAEIAKYLDGRTESMVKNRYYSYIVKKRIGRNGEILEHEPSEELPTKIIKQKPTRREKRANKISKSISKEDSESESASQSMVKMEIEAIKEEQPAFEEMKEEKCEPKVEENTIKPEEVDSNLIEPPSEENLLNEQPPLNNGRDPKAYEEFMKSMMSAANPNPFNPFGHMRYYESLLQRQMMGLFPHPGAPFFNPVHPMAFLANQANMMSMYRSYYERMKNAPEFLRPSVDDSDEKTPTHNKLTNLGEMSAHEQSFGLKSAFNNMSYMQTKQEEAEGKIKLEANVNRKEALVSLDSRVDSNCSKLSYSTADADMN